MGKRRRSCGSFEDQFGEMTSQDRDERFQHSSGKGTGGGVGAAGGRRHKQGDLIVTRHIPKFLEAHSHLIKPRKDMAHSLRKEDDSDQEDVLEGEALLRALEDNPSLIIQHPELSAAVQTSKASSLKEKGNRAFSSQNFDEAVRIFSECIELDPQNEVYYSNRAAALTGLKRYEEAIVDACKVIDLKPQWTKGHSRLGAAYFGKEEYLKAQESCAQALRLDPDNVQLQQALERAVAGVMREEAAGKHTFIAHKDEEVRDKQTMKKSPAKMKNKTLLSFNEEEGG